MNAPRLFSGEEGPEVGPEQGLRLHPVRLVRGSDARAEPAAHDRRPVVRRQNPQLALHGEIHIVHATPTVFSEISPI